MLDTPFNWTDEFPILNNCIFLNHAAVAPLPARAGRELREFADEATTLGGAAWPRWARRMKTARLAAARLLGADQDDIAFAHNTTHGLLCVANSLPWRPGENIVTASHEFPANVYPWKNLARRGVALRVVPERPDHTYRVEDFIERFDGNTRLVSISLVQYSTGYRMPVEGLAKACRQRGILLCLDAIQGLGALPVQMAELDCDFLIADAHKWLLGPEGIGLFYVRRDVLERLNESMTGWLGRIHPADYDDLDQPLLDSARRFEEGSYNMAGICALGESLNLLNEFGLEQVWQRIESITGELVEDLRALGYVLHSPRGAGERSGIVAVDKPGVDLAAIAKRLEAENIHVALRRGWLRFAPHFYNQPEQIRQVMNALRKIEAQ